MSRNQYKKPPLFFCLVAAIILFAESIAIVMFGKMPSGFLMVLPFHLAIVTALGLWVYYVYRRKESRLAMLLLIMTAATGPFGAGIGLLTAIGYVFSARSAIPPSEWIANFFSYEEDEESERIHERIALGMDDSAASVEPFQDILIRGTVLEKQMVISRMTRYFRPGFTQLLLEAVQDPNAAVRVQAATAIAKIEKEFMTECISLEKMSKGMDRNNRLRLAELYDNYAYTGLEDEASSSILRIKAIKIYEACQKECYENLLQARLARLYMRNNQPEKTCELLESTMESGRVVSSSNILWYMESLFRMGKLKKIRQIATHYENRVQAIGAAGILEEVDTVFRAWTPDIALPSPSALGLRNAA